MNFLVVIYFLCYISNIKSSYVDISDAINECTNNDEDENNKIVMRCMDSNDDFDASEYDCTKAKYVHHCNKIRKLWSNSVAKPSKPSPIAVEDKSSSSFMMLFESYLLKKKPFKIDMTSYSNISKEMCHENLLLNNYNNNEIPLSSCSQQLMSDLKTRVHLPFIADAHYLNRITYDSVAYNTANEGEFNNYLTHWPALYTSNDNNWTKLQYCPLNMHLIVWGLTRRASVRLFLKSAGHKFKPQFGFNKNMFPHYPDFVDNSIMNSNKDAEIPKYSKIELDQAEAIFIPNNYLAQIKWEYSENDRENNLLKFCLVDASNFKEVKDDLELEAALSPSADLILQKLSAFDFDTTMTKSPAERMWKDTGLKLDISNIGASPVEAPSESDSNSGKKDMSSGRSRRRRGGGNKGVSTSSAFKDWQSSAKWDVMIQSLTLPDPPVPTIHDVGRTNASISWVSYYRPPEQDTAFFGYNITICPETSIIDYTDSKGCIYKQLIKNINLTEIYRRKLSVRQGRKIFSIDLFSSDLVPNTSYRVRIVMLHASAVSDPSEWSASFTTLALTPPSPIHGNIRVVPAADSAHAISIAFSQPIDNGGSILLGYHVLACKLGASVDRTCRYRWKGDFLVTEDSLEQIVINNLQPSSKYKIQIAAFNELGNSTFKTSNIVQTKPLSAFPKIFGDGTMRTIYGHGTKQHLSMQAQDHESLEEYLQTHPLANMDHFTKTSNVFYINDRDQTIHTIINDIKREVEVWSSYWSPKSHIVASEAIFYDHFAEMEMLDLVGNIYGRIVVVTRDHVPIIVKALKAQSLGALAMVIIDNGKCNAFDQKCFPGSDKRKGELFAAIDTPKNWIELKIPVVFALQNALKIFEDAGMIFPTTLDGFRRSIEVDPMDILIEEGEEEFVVVESGPGSEVASESNLEVEDTANIIVENDLVTRDIDRIDDAHSSDESSEPEIVVKDSFSGSEDAVKKVDEEGMIPSEDASGVTRNMDYDDQEKLEKKEEEEYEIIDEDENEIEHEFQTNKNSS